MQGPKLSFDLSQPRCWFRLYFPVLHGPQRPHSWLEHPENSIRSPDERNAGNYDKAVTLLEKRKAALLARHWRSKPSSTRRSHSTKLEIWPGSGHARQVHENPSSQPCT